jgi:hypothetical protein
MNSPEPPTHAHFAANMEIDMGFTESYGSVPRLPHGHFQMGAESTPMYHENSSYGYNDRSSPSTYPEDSDMRLPSCNLSTASATSSNPGSPLSNPAQMSSVPEWNAPQGLGVTPGIVGQHEFGFPASSEYSFAAPQVEDFTQFEYAQPKAPGFVGELPQISILSNLSSSLSSTRRHGSAASSISGASQSTIIPDTSLAVSTLFTPRTPALSASPISSVSSRHSSIAFQSPTTSSSTSFSSPPAPAWHSPCADDLSPRSNQLPPAGRILSPFFSQSSGHFVQPLGSSCWFPSDVSSGLHGGLLTISADFADLCPKFADPTLIHPDLGRQLNLPAYETSYPPQHPTYPGSPALTGSPLRHGSASPFMHNAYQPYSPFAAPMDPQGRRQSVVSFHSAYSGEQQYSGDEKEKTRCPDCGRVFKDLRAHTLTHQTERPEKCPITTCEYHVKGFARKYDKNRHTLTHYKGNMVCGFCPGSGSAAEKSFNRADVFKRHLTAVHGVEQTAPNSRKKAGSASNSGKKLQGYAADATGKCSTCSATFSNAQDFYEHLDDCVLRIVQQEDPAEAINAKRLAEVENDRDVHNTLEKNQLPTQTQSNGSADEEDDDAEDEEMDDDEAYEDSKVGIKSASNSPARKSKGNPINGVQKSRGLTHSRGGVPLQVKTKGRKNRNSLYPSSWGFDKGQMTMRKRVMAVFDGPRRLAKDDMMLSTDNEMRLKLSDGKSYITDLDVQTLKRAEGFLNATDEEKGPWVSDDPTEEDIKQMLESSKSTR